ncbi:hypothetical protein HK099_008346 [Clydaea vesicula]|uniref:G-protein coupled receptors family 1 profile domain-containing protein n=1 Tax=Clydaea vesicula TaxID=447962 RepID=A0AAD5TW47_9FUNG|nr:hypothetical protein HK099_008346 [Clydaea vesicula]
MSLPILITNEISFFESTKNVAYVTLVVDAFNFLLAIVNLILSYKTLRKGSTKSVTTLVFATNICWLMFSVITIICDILSVNFNINVWNFPSAHPMWIVLIIRFFSYTLSLLFYQILTVKRFSTVVQSIHQTPIKLHYILYFIAIAFNVTAILPAMVDYFCCLLDPNWMLDNGEGVCNGLLVMLNFDSYSSYYSFEFTGGLLQVFGIPIFEGVLGLTLLMILSRLKSFKDSPIEKELRKEKVNNDIKAYLLLFVFTVFASGID